MPVDRLDRFSAATGFDWDEGNSGKSLRKHDVHDWEAEQVFFHEPLVLGEDAGHSAQGEVCCFGLGNHRRGPRAARRVLPTWHPDPLISARPMTRREREHYYRHV